MSRRQARSLSQRFDRLEECIRGRRDFIGVFIRPLGIAVGVDWLLQPRPTQQPQPFTSAKSKIGGPDTVVGGVFLLDKNTPFLLSRNTPFRL